jgi:leucyl aminopeptidase
MPEERTMVSVKAVRGRLEGARFDLLLVPLAEGQKVPAGVRRALGRRADLLARRARVAEFRGRADDLLLQHDDRPVALLGLGAAPATMDAWRRAGARGRQEAERQRARRVLVYVGKMSDDAEPVTALIEGFGLAGYRFTRYASQAEPQRRVKSLGVAAERLPAPSVLRETVRRTEVVLGEVFRARDLVNEPASMKTPHLLGAAVRKDAAGVRGLNVEVWGPGRIRRTGLAGLLAVARGSQEEPRFIVLRWAPPASRRRVALVGKAITFDSGGLSLKPAKSMETMKYDMAGGAAVIGAVTAAARLGLPVAVTGYVAATENLPSGSAQKPGDVIRHLNGKTVEVLNTDAEGRLVLADALALACREKPDALVDLATLTGACRVALGTLVAGVMGNDQPLVDRLVAAGREAGEPLWQLPLVRDYRADLKSAVADLKNVGGPEAGCIVGGLFLEEFVDGVPWAHLDIAGPAFTEKELPHATRGGTGFGVRLLVRYLAGLVA